MILLALALSAQVLIQAGHQGRPGDCISHGGHETERLCHNTGSPAGAGEMAWTPIVADETTRILRVHGINVIRRPAYLGNARYYVDLAVYLHFDGSTRPCSSGASVGYPAGARNRKLATTWKALYARAFPYRFMPDNFTVGERRYYAYENVNASIGQFLFEGAEMSCPPQYAWMKRHLHWEARLLAAFIDRQLGRSDISMPAGEFY